MNRDLAEAGIVKKGKDGSVIHLHALRHSFGTHLSRAGVAPRTAQAAMRHSNISLTMNTYTDSRLLDTAAAVEALPSLRLGQSSVAPTVAPDSVPQGTFQSPRVPSGQFGEDQIEDPESEETLEKQGNFVVGGTELESVTSTMSTKCLTNKTLVFPAFLTSPTLYKSHKSHQFSCEKGRQKGTKLWLSSDVAPATMSGSPALPRMTSRDIVTQPSGATMATRRPTMGRPKFRIAVDDLMHAARYLDGRLGSLAVAPLTMPVQEARRFFSEILMSPKSESSATRLQEWCDENLEPATLRLLQIAVRKRRQRTRTNDYRVVTISNNAYHQLCKLAKRDNVTLSKALERSVTKLLRLKEAQR